MSKMDVATKFFHACEQLEGSEGCAQFVSDGARFEAQCEPLTEIATLLEYCDWMKSIGEGPLAGCSYELVSSCFDTDRSIALFYAIFRATHRGSGGPVEPTGKSTVSHYVYAVTVNDEEKVSHMVKVWNAPWALRELGWS